MPIRMKGKETSRPKCSQELGPVETTPMKCVDEISQITPIRAAKLFFENQPPMNIVPPKIINQKLRSNGVSIEGVKPGGKTAPKYGPK